MARGLRPALVGRRVASIQVRDVTVLQGIDAEALDRRARGAVVLEVRRRGKWVVLSLDEPRGIIVIQPRMTGGFWLVPPPHPAHVRFTIKLVDVSDVISFQDPRRFGRLAWYPDDSAAEAACARSLGPDALEIALPEFAKRLKRTTRAIKPVLMDQKVLAGLGNIYADEVLFHARLHPSRRSDRLRPAEVAALHAAIRPVLESAIAAEGSSFDEGYRTVLGLEGGFLAINAIHRRGGKPCVACGEPIVKTRIAGLIGRPTYFCPRCQSLRRGGGRSGRESGDRVR